MHHTCLFEWWSGQSLDSVNKPFPVICAKFWPYWSQGGKLVGAPEKRNPWQIQIGLQNKEEWVDCCCLWFVPRQHPISQKIPWGTPVRTILVLDLVWQCYLFLLQYIRVQNGSPGSTRFYGPVHLRRYWSVPVSTGPYILGRPVKFSNSQDADNLHTIRKRMPIPFQWHLDH